MEADAAYLRSMGGTTKDVDDLRSAFVETIASVASGEPPPRQRRSGKHWTPRYAVRRSAWHALDHAWEIEDRAT